MLKNVFQNKDRSRFPINEKLMHMPKNVNNLIYNNERSFQILNKFTCR